MAVALNSSLTGHHPLHSAKLATDTRDRTEDLETSCIE
jgi:hypothetical protein